MSHTNFYGADFGFDSSNSSSTLTLKFDDCEAITESTVNSASEAYADQYHSTAALMENLKDNPVLTTASMPIPTRSAAGGNNPMNNLMNQNSRMNLDYSLDYDLSQDLNMPQILLMDGNDLNDDSSPTLFAPQYAGHGDSSGENMVTSVGGGDPLSVSRASVVPSMSGSHQQPQQQQQQHLIATTTGGHQMWGSDTQNNLLSNAVSGNAFVAKAEPFNLDDDAIFHVDKADLLQGTHFNDDPFLDISLDDIIPQDENALLDEGHSLQTLQNVISPLNSCTISPSSSGYSNTSSVGIAVPHQSYHHLQQQFCMQQQPQQGLPVHSPPESVSLYETLNRSPYNLNAGPIVSPPTPTNSLTNHFQSLSAVVSPRARTIAMSQPNSNATGGGGGASQMAIRKYKTNAANQHTKRSALHDLLRKEPGDSATLLGQSVGSAATGGYVSQQGSMAAMAHRNRLAQYHHLQMSRLSTSAPTQLGMDQLWQRREPRPHLLSTSSVAEAGSTSSLSTGGVLSPEAPDFSQDEAYSDDSDHYDDFSSDDDSDDDEQKFSKSLGSGGPGGRKMSKSERYFWQYNVQAKGPKGQRLVIKTEMEDPHVLNEATDPVFSPNCSVRGIKHSGKARKGDGNDLTPNPRKLNSIGRELDKLCRIINDITPVSELPFNARTKTRKEKNKLASRACRLKKKAQHEANKIKLYGLEVEHKRLLAGIANTKSIITSLTQNPYNREGQEEVAQQIERIYQSASKIKIAGMSTEYVNQILEKVKGGAGGGGGVGGGGGGGGVDTRVGVGLSDI